MKNTLLILLKFYLFWLFYFLVNRILFCVLFYSEISQISLLEVLKIFPHSMSLDLSSISYILIIVTFFLLLTFLNPNRFFRYISCFFIKWFNIILIIISSLVIGSEVALYTEWGAKLNFTALSLL